MKLLSKTILYVFISLSLIALNSCSKNDSKNKSDDTEIYTNEAANKAVTQTIIR